MPIDAAKHNIIFSDSYFGNSIFRKMSVVNTFMFIT